MNELQKKNLKQFFIVAAALLLLIVTLVIVFVETDGIRKDKRIMKTNEGKIAYIERVADIKLPDDVSVVCVLDIESLRYMERYYVFQFKSDATEWLNDNRFQKEHSAHAEYEFKSLRNRDVLLFPQEYVPNTDGECFWLENERWYLLYCADDSRLFAYYY